MRRWGVLSLISISAFVAPIVTAVPAHASCFVYVYGRCISSGPTSPPTTAPPAPTPTPPPAPTPPPPAPTPPPAAPVANIDPNEAATQFFDLTNGARAGAGVGALQWRADVANMAVAHSLEMAQQGTIWHGSFVSTGNLKALNASSLGENVGMGGDVGSIQDAFMNSPHHLENILDGAYNQVGIGVIVSGGVVYVTVDFLHSNSAATARPTPVAHPAAPKPSAPRASSPKVASAAPRHVSAAATSAPPSAAPPVTTPAPPQPQGVITPVDFGPAAASAATVAAAGTLSNVLDGGMAVWAAMFGVLLLVGLIGGPVVVRRRRPA
jgi:uncharacterized protein YkwD